MRTRLRRYKHSFLAAAVAPFLASVSVTSASAYRPFDGTDAAVANVSEVEIEFQPAGVLRAGSTKALSDAVLNYGFAERWELVLQGTAQTPPEGARRLGGRRGIGLPSGGGDLGNDEHG
jgi:hypothetical protein